MKIEQSIPKTEMMKGVLKKKQVYADHVIRGGGIPVAGQSIVTVELITTLGFSMILELSMYGGRSTSKKNPLLASPATLWAMQVYLPVSVI